MERIEPKLLLNYKRPIGAKWTGSITSTATGSSVTGKVFIFPEILVPTSPEDATFNLTSLANTIYMAAREKNMSLSSYGHLDPVKFVLAATYLALLAEEVRRDLSLAQKFEFGNRAYGETLCVAVASTSLNTILTNMASYVVRLNALIKRINQLYIPAIKLLAEWMPHRTRIYKDDEGERYQFYAYKMANYYQLDVNPSSINVGQLIFKPISCKSTTISAKLTLIENLLNSYESDDDFVNFATEAIKAGLSRVVLKEIITSGDSIMLPAITEEFSIDDVCSLENAYYISPVFSSVPLLFTSAVMTWDIRENVNTGKFEVGKWNSIPNRLPVMHPFSSITSYRGNPTNSHFEDNVNRRPLFTHAQVESESGLRYLTKYVAAVGGSSISRVDGALEIFVEGDPHTMDTTTQQTKYCTYLSTHSPCMLLTPYAYYEHPSTGGITTVGVPVFGMYVDKTEAQSLLDYNNFFAGFKGKPYTYAISAATENELPVWLHHDYDYLVNVNDINLNQFNASYLWNDFIMISASDLGIKRDYSKSNRKHK